MLKLHHQLLSELGGIQFAQQLAQKANVFNVFNLLLRWFKLFRVMT